MAALDDLTARELESLAAAIDDGRLAVPVSEYTLQRVLGRVPPPTLAAELAEVLTGAASATLRLLARRRPAASPELVWSGPDETHTLRATSVVVDELFSRAQRRVLLAGFAIVRGASVFKTLARRFDENEALTVRVVVNVHGRRDNQGDLAIGLFAQDFWRTSWPGQRRPEVFYDPRSLLGGDERAVMHAKCVVADGEAAFVTSANFTPHAQHKNVELGVLVEQAVLARQIEAQFDALIERGHLVRLPG